MAILDGFVGGFATARSSKASIERCMNLMPEPIEGGRGLSGARAYLIGTPGLKLFANLNSGIAQGLYEADGRCFSVCGGRVREVFADGTNSVIGGPLGTLQPASIANNPSQLCIVCGPGFIINLQGAATLTPIPTTDGFTLANTVTFQDSYFIFGVPNSTKFVVSAPNDGLTVGGLDFGNKQGAPDPLAAVYSVNKTLWMIGTKTSEPYWNNGISTPPFVPVQGLLREVGTAAYMSPAIAGSELFWLAQNKRGTGFVVAAQNMATVRVSTFAIENAIQQYLRDGLIISDAIGSSYQENGHDFYKLDFPSADATWVFDASTREWHERGYWDSQGARYRVHLGRFQCFCFGKHLTLADNGIIYEQSQDFYDDAGADIRRLRRAPHQSAENTNVRYDAICLDMQRGSVPLGVNALMTLRYSDDGGKQWSDERTISAGLTGDYNYPRARWKQTGSGRDRVIEVTSSARISHEWINLYYGSTPSTEQHG